ncbi:RNA polymerase sigma-70 factor [uncultured Bacteroides sp.]|uniref:RNA polymerase sigma-70 factor n=1 Tax=uncultured Bacteroides sp. TaxID=162156 RepID=UPI0027DC8D1E|nr:RNA polymerase sigma-70 factor [uncultured Bacteroides sp.]
MHLENRRDIINPFDINSEMNFGVFYNAYYQRFVRYAFYYVNDLQAAEDLTHDALLYYWENRQKLPADTDVLGYILQTVKNKCLNYLKHIQVEVEYSKKHTELHEWEIETRIQTLEDESYGTIFSKDIMKIVMESLSELPEQTRRIFVMNRLDDKSRKEIAALLNVSQQKVDYHINKANDHLCLKLKDYIPLVLLFLS